MPSGTKVIIAVILMLLPCCIPQAYSAFHSGGVGSCSGCHVGGHGSEEGLPVTTGTDSPMLRGSDPGSVCLNCHAGTGSSLAPSVLSFDGSALTPGGDFYWLARTFTWADGSSPASSHGHNVIAQDFGLSFDLNNIEAPGGNYPSDQLSCISCHDPHGRSRGGTAAGAPPVSVSGSYGDIPVPGSKSGNYRLLGDEHYIVGGFSFNNPAPIARQNPILPFAESDSSHVDYGNGMSAWCGNCHGGMVGQGHQSHVSETSSFRHSTEGTLGSRFIGSYNAYVNSNDLSGSFATAYLQFVPFARGTSNVQQLDPTSTQGMDSSSRINCLSCHRAHASAFSAAGRWDFNADLLVDSHPALGDSGATVTDVANSYYNRDIVTEFSSDQGPFCEKCHADDSGMGM